jgi:hypothetical protein
MSLTFWGFVTAHRIAVDAGSMYEAYLGVDYEAYLGVGIYARLYHVCMYSNSDTNQRIRPHKNI